MVYVYFNDQLSDCSIVSIDGGGVFIDSQTEIIVLIEPLVNK